MTQLGTNRPERIRGHRTPGAPLLCALLFFLFGFALALAVSPVTSPGRQHWSAANALLSDLSGADAPALATAATVSQHLSSSTSYTIHVRWASGAEQFISVTAPPGGLDLEVRDMSGDNVPDVVLRPTMLHWPLTVLLNDGHNHFTAAISGVFPNFFDSGGQQASQGHPVQDFAVLAPSGANAKALAIRKRFLLLQVQGRSLPLIAKVAKMRLDHASSSGRAPPLATV